METVLGKMGSRESNASLGTAIVEIGKMEGFKKENAFHVLVVDDEYLIRYMISKALRHLGIRVDLAENGLQAQKKILSGNYHLVITDINMPEMDGRELLVWLKMHRPKIESIVITGYEIAETLSDDVVSGNVVEFLTKPFQMTELQEAVKRSMKRLLHRQEKNVSIND